MKRLRSWYGRNFLSVDLVLAIGAGVGLEVLMVRSQTVSSQISQLLNGNRAALYGAFASVFGSLLGFSIAAVAIVLNAIQSPQLDIVRKSQHSPTLWKAFKASVRWLAAATAISLVALAIDRDTSPLPILTAATAAAGLLAATRVAHTIWILEQVVGIATSRQEHY